MRVFFGLGLLLIANISMAGQVYRYMDAQDHSVIEQQISPQAIKQGYTILDDRGNVVSTVKPARELQQQQKQQQKEVQEREKAAIVEKKQEAMVELQPVVSVTPLTPASPSTPFAAATPAVASSLLTVSDEKLLELFKTPDDALRVRDRKLQDLDTAIGFLRGRLQVLQAEQKLKIAEAAALEFNGKPVPAIYMTNFSEQVSQLQQAQADLLAKQNEQQAVKLDYDNTIKRLRALVGAKKGLQGTQLLVGS